MTILISVIAELTALAVGIWWIGLAVSREAESSAQHFEQAVSGRLLAPSLELQVPFVQRVVEPLLRRSLQALGQVTPKVNLERLRRDLLVAGSPLGLGALDFVGLRIVVTVLGTAGTIAAVWMVFRSLVHTVLFGLVGIVFFAELPNFWLHRRMSARRRTILRALPDALDMLIVCVDAGLGLESSFLRMGEGWSHALAQEFKRAVMEIGIGVSWREALRNLVYRTDVSELSSLVAVLLQADLLGFSISDTLHAQGDQLRRRRRHRAQEMARAAPLKMLFPMVFCIMPATFAVVIGPALPAILEALSAAQ